MEDYHFLESIKNDVLDTYLEHGWYRMGNLVFTTDMLSPREGGLVHPVFWLRYRVYDIVLKGSSKKIYDNARKYEVNYKNFELTDEIIDLHKRYHNSVNFITSDNLQKLLVDVNNAVYDSKLIEIRDNGKLVAAGILDVGKATAAGIINIFDPEYKKISPGKMLMLMKYKYCHEHNIPMYYPGYYSPTYSAFDYKLFIDEDATEVMIPGIYTWVPYKRFKGFISGAFTKNIEEE